MKMFEISLHTTPSESIYPISPFRFLLLRGVRNPIRLHSVPFGKLQTNWMFVVEQPNIDLFSNSGVLISVTCVGLFTRVVREGDE